MLRDIFSRPDTRWVLATFSVMGVLNLASRMNAVYAGGGVLGVVMAFIGIGGWIHGIASVARSAQDTADLRGFALLVAIFFGGGCLLAMPWHFFMFGDPAAAHPAFYLLVQILLAATYTVLKLILPPDPFYRHMRHAILGYATFACLFQSVSPKVSTDTLMSELGLDLTMAFSGSTLLILAIMTADLVGSLILQAQRRRRARKGLR